MQGEPVDLLNTYGRTPIHKWRYGAVGTWREKNLTIGILPDGRWYLNGLGKALAYDDEETARHEADELMTEHGDGWVEVDPEPTLGGP